MFIAIHIRFILPNARTDRFISLPDTSRTYSQQKAKYHRHDQEQVVRLERERDSLVIRSEAYDRIETELTAYRQKMEQLEREILVLSGDNNLLDNTTGKVDVDVDVPKLLCALKDDPLHVNPSKEEWSEIIGMTDLLFNNFLTDLRNKYSITRHEQEICCLIKWNFSRKEQLTVFNNTPDALTKSKGRLKKRLGLDEKTDLDAYVRLL